MKHTPGPWEFFDAKNEHGEITIGIRGNSEFIATMDLVAIGNSPFRLPQNADANARLIAAAPSLLEALQRLVKDGITPAAWDQAEAAIAEATGKTE